MITPLRARGTLTFGDLRDGRRQVDRDVQRHHLGAPVEGARQRVVLLQHRACGLGRVLQLVLG